MYKIILWRNYDTYDIQPLLQKRSDILEIGNGKKMLKWSDLTLEENILSQVTENPDFIFYSHGMDEGKTCGYELQDEDGKVKNYSSIDVIKEILKHAKFYQAVSLHMLSCYVGRVSDELLQHVKIASSNGELLNSAFFLHGGDEKINFHRIESAFTLIDKASGDVYKSQPSERNLYLFNDLYVNTPGDLFFIQCPSQSDKNPLALEHKFIGDSFSTLSYYLADCLRQYNLHMSKFSADNDLRYKSDQDRSVNLFNYLKNGWNNGNSSHCDFRLPLKSGNLDGKAEIVDDSDVTKFVDDLYSLVEADNLSKEQFDELLAIRYFFNAQKLPGIKISYPDGYGLKITSSYEKLFNKGFDITKVLYYDAPFIISLLNGNLPPETVIAFLSMNDIKCSTFNTPCLSSYLFDHVIRYNYSAELLPVILKKLDNKIDLSLKIEDNFSLLDSISNLDAFKAHYNLIMEKSCPVTQEETSLLQNTDHCTAKVQLLGVETEEYV